MYQVIIIEDDPMVASINKQYLEAYPELQAVGIFPNGEEALAYLQEHTVDLALVDYYMPVMDGATFVHQCRSRHIPMEIIMITAANGAKEIKQLMQLGVIDYLVKPFSSARFRQSIDLFLERHRALDARSEMSQEEIDQLLVSGRASGNPMPPASATEVVLEKGLQQQTLDMVKQFLDEHPDKYYSCVDIANEISLSRITVRRYMNHLLDQHYITSQVDYSTGGRPSIKYRKMR